MFQSFDLAKARRIVVAGLLGLIGLIALGLPGTLASGNHVEVLTVDGTITPVMRTYIHQGIDHAEKSGATAVVLRMDTPGGLSSATDDIIQDILNSSVPVIVYVAPQGARAASAGVYITYAAHIAAMAPSTNIGSATPIFIGQNGQAATADDTLTRKVVNDAVARIRGLATLRGRNADWAEQAVRNAVNITADEAKQQNVIDVVAPDLPTLLNDVDGRKVQTSSGVVTLATAGADIQAQDMTFPEEFFQTISDPTIAYILLSVGMLGLFFELANPGSILPGVAGGISILLALSSLGNLDPSWAGILLMGFAFVVFLVDLYLPSHGALTIGGIASFVLGSFLLSNSVNSPATSISRLAILTVTLLISAFFIFAVGAVVRTRLTRSTTGREGMLGTTGTVKKVLDPEGLVYVSGELWRARSLNGEIPIGTMVRVVDVEGLTVIVEALATTTAEEDSGDGSNDAGSTPKIRRFPVQPRRTARRHVAGR
jgi:membrane-bound serine protease (ClpP class)